MISIKTMREKKFSPLMMVAVAANREKHPITINAIAASNYLLMHALTPSAIAFLLHVLAVA